MAKGAMGQEVSGKKTFRGKAMSYGEEECIYVERGNASISARSKCSRSTTHDAWRGVQRGEPVRIAFIPAFSVCLPTET